MRYCTAAVLAAFLVSGPALSHDGFEDRTDPVTGVSCCTSEPGAKDVDCGVLNVEPGMLELVEDGYQLKLTEAQARAINPQRTGSVNTFIPRNRVQQSWDGQYRLCIPPRRYDYMPADIYCFFAPLPSA